jgi:hypothetical protein
MSDDNGRPEFLTLAELLEIGFRVYELPSTPFRDLRGRPVWNLEEVENELDMRRVLMNWWVY